MATVDKLFSLLEAENIAKKLSADDRKKIADDIIRGYKIDRESRSEWEARCVEAIKFAKQITKPKSFPFDGASNVIFPLLTIAANTFAARVYPEIVKEGRIVKGLVLGADPDGSKSDRANRVSSHMSYQRLIQSETWESDLDQLLHILPIIGVCFRKVYFDPVTGMPQSDLCSPQDIVLNHTEKSIEKAYRVTHRYTLNKNEIYEKMRSGYFIKMDMDKLQVMPLEDIWQTSLDDNAHYEPDEDNNNQKLEILEVHTYLDLDKDGYEEPWIVVVDKANREVLGIYPRFDQDDINVDDEGNLVSITPINYFVDSHFLPSPDGGFYSLGYGHVLYPLNSAINSLMNQLIDSGTLANTNSGLIGRNLKIKGGSLKVKMGEYIPVEVGTTGRIQDSVFPFQFKDPSPTILQLLGLVINSAKEIASINDVLTGEAKPQNSPAHSVMELSNQGMKVFSSITKRLYKSLKKEFKLLYKLNSEYLDQDEYFNYHDRPMAISQQDYNMEGVDIVPIADPNMSSDVQRTLQAQAMAQLMQNQHILPEMKINNVVREFFEALKVPEEKIDQFVFTPEEKMQMMQAQGQQPNPEMLKIQLDMEKAQKDFEVKMAQVERANRELELKYLDLMKKYELKDAETAEKQARMMADAKFKQAQADTMDDKLEIERDKVEVMRQKAQQERANANKKQQS